MAKGANNARPGTGAETAKRGWGRGFLKGAAAVAAFVFFSGLIVYAYNKGKEAGGGNTPPIIKAGPAPYKVRPDQPGGMQVLNRDKQIYSEIEGGPKPPVVERLLPPAETPMAPTAVAPKADSPAAPPAPTPAAPKSPPTAAAAEPSAKSPPAPEKKRASSAPKPATRPAKPDIASTARRLSKIAPAARGGYKIQLASLRSNTAVAQSWKKLVKSNKDLLGGLRLTIARRDFGSGKGVYFRMQAGPLPDAVAARDLCSRLKRRRLNCLVIRP